jgi:(5-formylfuran-3-yl)methyl phosphate synthase
MQLLVSVRSAAEVAAALAGGADIIDAKEPARGSLGPVDPSALREISASVPPSIPLSAALGDFEGGADAADAIGALDLPARPAEVFVKLGLVRGAGDGAETSLRAAVAAARTARCRPRIVVVAYADQSEIDGTGPGEVARLAARVGAHGVLLDTSSKDGRDLFTFMAPAQVKAWVCAARTVGLMAAVAGSLRTESLGWIREIDPTVVGVRGAACTGGREGTIDAEKVRELRRTLDALFPRMHAVG